MTLIVVVVGVTLLGLCVWAQRWLLRNPPRPPQSVDKPTSPSWRRR